MHSRQSPGCQCSLAAARARTLPSQSENCKPSSCEDWMLLSAVFTSGTREMVKPSCQRTCRAQAGAFRQQSAASHKKITEPYRIPPPGKGPQRLEVRNAAVRHRHPSSHALRIRSQPCSIRNRQGRESVGDEGRWNGRQNPNP